MYDPALIKIVLPIWGRIAVGVTLAVFVVVSGFLYLGGDDPIGTLGMISIPVSTIPTTLAATYWIVSTYEKKRKSVQEKQKNSFKKFLDSQLTAITIQREDFSWYYMSNAYKELIGISYTADARNPIDGFWENRDEATVHKDRELLRDLPTGIVNELSEPVIFNKATGDRLYFKVQSKWIENPLGKGRLLLSNLENVTDLIAQQNWIQQQASILEKQTEKLEKVNESLRQRNNIIQQQKNTLAIQAYTDPLTGLWNRLALREKLALDGDAERGQDFALYLLNMDNFKSVNEFYSHRVGDDLLVAIGQTLRDLSQKGDIVIRFGGEEFLVLTPWIDFEATRAFCGTLRRALGETQITIQGKPVSRTSSVGIAKLSRVDPFDLALSLANLALSEAKKLGGNCEIMADEAFQVEMKKRGAFITEIEVEAGIRAHQIKYYVQPIYNTERKEFEGFETLIRWIRPDGTIIPPGMFLEKFNKVFFKPELQDIRTKMRHDVLTNLSDYPNAYVSWNYELDQFLNDDFTEQFIIQANEAVKIYGMKLVVEISERSFISHVHLEKIELNLQKIRNAGILIALDDFGTEHSNFHRLMRLPIDIIKLDKSLIDECETSARTRSTVLALSILAKRLKIKVIAEGIEAEPQCEILNKASITSQQGYLHAKPMDPHILAS